MTTNWPELDKDHLIKICIDQNIELDALRAKLAAMESQKPIAYVHPQAIQKAKKLSYGELRFCNKTNSGPLDVPIYTKPVPADKPAAAVPNNELLAARQEVEDLCGKAPFYPVDAEKLRNLCVRLIDENMLLRQSAPSHSQQGTNRIAAQDLNAAVAAQLACIANTVEIADGGSMERQNALCYAANIIRAHIDDISKGSL